MIKQDIYYSLHRIVTMTKSHLVFQNTCITFARNLYVLSEGVYISDFIL